MNFVIRYVRPLACLLLLTVLAACSSTKDVRRVPTELAPIKTVLEVREAWKASVGKSGRSLFAPAAVGDYVYAAGANGSVVKIDATNGKEVWRTKVGADLSAGVGSDGTLTAVGTLKGDVFVLGGDGKVLWRANAPGEIVTPPAVGQGFVLVRTIDGRITAFNAQTGEQKWVYVNRAVPLNLRTATGMTFAGNSAVLAGFPGGSLAAINLQSGDAYWQTPVSYPRGVTEVERINDVVGAPTLVGSQTCAVTFQGRIGCFDVLSGRALWEQPFSSYGGLAQDDRAVASTDDWSIVSLYDAMTGESLWQNTQLTGRDVSTPAIVGRAVVVGDYKGFVHFLSRDTGEFVARMRTGGAIIAQPVVAGNTLVVQTRDGDLYGFRPQ
ncbi:outer membrane protein assembly factor BamB [Mycetohabitans endofungorum]|uniref:outer membrane protein assembly factor BamB n=1 Tax=Mycetohabitans endofungorum TaxID=417203 RepID=UPI002B05C818|nr:outer membrane protein assembly factor BamB [Mycetohabitans endofungorum]